jgi:hypothetical protein
VSTSVTPTRAAEPARGEAPHGETEPQREPRQWALLPSAIRRPRRPHWWQELLFVAICYELYSLVRNAAPSHEAAAFRRAHDLLSFETTLHVDIEPTLNRFVASHSWLAYGCDYYYATLHFVVTIGVMVWLYRRHAWRYRTLRTVLLATNVAALVGFWLFSLAPPRMLPGFVDTIVDFHTWGSWGSSSVDSASNQFAAMPSLHVAWSLWCGIVIVRLASRRWLRILGGLYPAATVFVIVGTANHFVLDAVGGVVVLATGFAIQRVLAGRGAFAPLPVPLPRGPQPAPQLG